jgi:hypothetical protein
VGRCCCRSRRAADAALPQVYRNLAIETSHISTELHLMKRKAIETAPKATNLIQMIPAPNPNVIFSRLYEFFFFFEESSPE